MNAITWVLFGLIIGVGAHLIDPTAGRGGFFGAVLLGVSGAVIGGSLMNLMFGISLRSFDLTSFLIAIVGSVALLFMNKTLRHV